jgi:phosphoribosylformimino-5-aminoimidazole carboxamide ribotide isomerase
VLATDISKDGMQVGLNTKFYKTLTTTYNNINFIASGGVSSYDDITTLNKYHVYGAVIGKALYENKIKLEKAIALC